MWRAWTTGRCLNTHRPLVTAARLGRFPPVRGRVFYKGCDEWDHHSVVLEEGGVGLTKIGYKVADPGDIEIYVQRELNERFTTVFT